MGTDQATLLPDYSPMPKFTQRHCSLDVSDERCANLKIPSRTNLICVWNRDDGWDAISILAKCASSTMPYSMQEINQNRKDKSLGLLCYRLLQEYSRSSEVIHL